MDADRVGTKRVNDPFHNPTESATDLDIRAEFEATQSVNEHLLPKGRTLDPLGPRDEFAAVPGASCLPVPFELGPEELLSAKRPIVRAEGLPRYTLRPMNAFDEVAALSTARGPRRWFLQRLFEDGPKGSWGGPTIRGGKGYRTGAERGKTNLSPAKPPTAHHP